MGNQAFIESEGCLMSNLLINEPPLQVLPSLAAAIGLNEALLLQQVHYWLRHAKVEHDGKMWIYKTYEEWQKQDFSFWSVRTVKRTVINLIDRNLLMVEKLSSNSFNRVNHYTINYAELLKLDVVQAPIPVNTDSDKLAQSRMTVCHEHSDKLAQSDSDNVSQSDSDKLAQCLRDKEETNNKNTKEKAAAKNKDVYTVIDSIADWNEPDINVINAMLMMGAPPMPALTQSQYDYHSAKFKNYYAEKEIEGSYIQTEGRRKDMLADWIKRDYQRNKASYHQTESAPRPHSNRSDSFEASQGQALSREQQIEINKQRMQKMGLSS